MIDQAAVPEALVEVPLPTWHTVEEAEFEEVANAVVGEGAEVGREAVVFCFARIGPYAGLLALDCLLRLGQQSSG